MTTNPEPIDTALDEYFELREGDSDEPNLDHFDPEDRAKIEQHIASLNTERCIDLEASRHFWKAICANR